MTADYYSVVRPSARVGGDYANIDEVFVQRNDFFFERNVLILAGPVGVGKSTIAQMLCSRNGGVSVVKNVTTRERRVDDPPDEMEFVSDSEFSRRADCGAFFFERKKQGIRYGYQKDRIDAKSDRWHVMMFRATGALSLERVVPRIPIVFLTAKMEHLADMARRRAVPLDDVVRTLELNQRLYSKTVSVTSRKGYNDGATQVGYRLWEFNSVEPFACTQDCCGKIEAFMAGIRPLKSD